MSLVPCCDVCGQVVTKKVAKYALRHLGAEVETLVTIELTQPQGDHAALCPSCAMRAIDHISVADLCPPKVEEA